MRLLKLHGSIDWEAEKSRDETLSEYRIAVAPEQTTRSPAVIFGGRNKVRAVGPFLELLGQFEVMLRAAGTLLIVGYSFRDDHVNEVIRRWINRDESHRIVVVEPNWSPRIRRTGDEFSRTLMSALRAHGLVPAPKPRPAFRGHGEIAAQPQRLKVIREGARAGLPAAVGIAAAVSRVWEPDTD